MRSFASPMVISLVLILALVWLVRDTFRSPTLSEREIEALAAAMRADTIGEKVENRPIAQDWVADVHLRLQGDTASKLSFLEIFETVVPVYPDTWKHGAMFTGRKITAIKKSQRYASSPWDLIHERAKEKAKQGPDPKRCATKYTRAEQRYDLFTGESTAAAELFKLVEDRKWKLDPAQPTGLIMKFFCPV